VSTIRSELVGGPHDGLLLGVDADAIERGEVILPMPTAPQLTAWPPPMPEPADLFRRARYLAGHGRDAWTADGARRFIFDPRSWA
jgi:hypothetical protein